MHTTHTPKQLQEVYNNAQEAPIYTVVLPLVRYAMADLQDWLHNNTDEDAAKLLEGVTAFHEFLCNQDTTVRETY